jgi:hypothetical protein
MRELVSFNGRQEWTRWDVKGPREMGPVGDDFLQALPVSSEGNRDTLSDMVDLS